MIILIIKTEQIVKTLNQLGEYYQSIQERYSGVLDKIDNFKLRLTEAYNKIKSNSSFNPLSSKVEQEKEKDNCQKITRIFQDIQSNMNQNQENLKRKKKPEEGVSNWTNNKKKTSKKSILVSSRSNINEN
jgi:hypothetical protein